MKFWDTSALAPLILEEIESPRMERQLQDDPGMVLWWGSVVECSSALARAEREGDMPRNQIHEGLGLLRALREAASEIEPGHDIRTRAARLLFVHPLRAADALQLAAALVWSEERLPGAGFVCLDKRLREAASLEGFEVLPQ